MAAPDAIVLNISDMIDLAIGTPEVGVVDFNMLQTVLHCLAQQQRVLGKNVEVRGSLVSVPMSKENVQTISIMEYAVDTDQTKKALAPPPPAPPPKDETILVVERVKKSELDGSPTRRPSANKVATGTAAGAQRGRDVSGKGREGGAGGGSGAEGSASGAPLMEKLSLVTISKFNVLENTVEDLRNRVYGSMPKNEDILQEVRSQTNIKAITDMWTNLNASSRLEAAEAGIGKLSSLVQDLINEITELQNQIPGAESRARSGTAASNPGTPGAAGAGGASGATSTAGVPGGTSAAGADGGADGVTSAGGGGIPSTASSAGRIRLAGGPFAANDALDDCATKRELANLIEHAARIRDDLDQLTDVFYAAMKEVKPDLQLNGPPPRAPPITMDGVPLSAADGSTGTANAAGGGGADGGAGGGPTGGGPSGATGRGPGGGPGVVAGGRPGGAARGRPSSAGGGWPLSSTAGIGDIIEKINELEKRLKKCCDKLLKDDDSTQDQINSLHDQMDIMSRQVLGPGSNLAGTGLSPDLIKDLQGLMQLFQTVQDMQDQLKNVHETALQLAAEKEDRQSHINTLLEQIELLKNIKLDREDMAEAMAEKADLRMLARKVSHDQFEMACDDLSRGLEHALGKLNMQEALWQQALDDIQREIETKLDKMELCPLKDFFNSKLKQLQEHLKQMASLRREAEAAGTKRKLLRDVNCISCDANAVMAMEAPPSMPVSKPLPASLSMKPYLSYELDTIRKAQASHLPQRNMHDWENIDKQMAQPKLPHRVRSAADKHMCNRYCGGSHTTTTPAQRVARLGHFIKQWGPDVLPLSSGLAAGDDGRMYRVQTTEAANVGPGGADEPTTCTPKSSPKKQTMEPEKPIIVTAECKCLEAAGN